MMNVEQLIETMRPDVERCIEGNETVARVRAGDVDRELLRRLVIAEFNCQEAELVTYGLLVARHHDDAPLNLFALIVQTLAQARLLLAEAARSVDLRPEEFSVATSGRLARAVGSLIAPGMLGKPGGVALYVHGDLAVWCPLYAQIASAARKLGNIPVPLIEYMEWWGSGPSPEFVDKSAETIAYGLEHGEDPEDILEAARQLDSIVADYWGFVHDK
ncbi:hypothetical protein [Embleya sp. NPDC020630]|uniref:hypothetical protein n=1 Tax=Embleya sp. NPDC020630 TaxID=3363979 RepID=UPI0037A3F644